MIWAIVMTVVKCSVGSTFAKGDTVMTVKGAIAMNANQLIVVTTVTDQAAVRASKMEKETSCTASVPPGHSVLSALQGEKILMICVRTVLHELKSIWTPVCGDEVQTVVKCKFRLAFLGSLT